MTDFGIGPEGTFFVKPGPTYEQVIAEYRASQKADRHAKLFARASELRCCLTTYDVCEQSQGSVYPGGDSLPKMIDRLAADAEEAGYNLIVRSPGDGQRVELEALAVPDSEIYTWEQFRTSNPPRDLDPAECVHRGGHCWVRSTMVTAGTVPTVQEGCKHCPAHRTGQPREGMAWVYPNGQP